MKALIVSMVLGTSFFAPHAANVQSNDDHGITWELPADALVSSNQISFNQASNKVWYFMEGTSLAHNPLTYQFLPNYSAFCPGNSGIAGLACWWDTVEPSNPFAAFPQIGVNFNDHAVVDPLSGTHAAHSMTMHPQNTRLAIIAWRSPDDMKVGIKGDIRSFYPSLPCGDGVRWSVEKGTTVLAPTRRRMTSAIPRLSP